MTKFILVSSFNPMTDQFCVLLSISVPDQQIAFFLDQVRQEGVMACLANKDVKVDLYAVEMVYYLLCVYFLIVAGTKNYDYVSWIQLVDAFCSSEKIKTVYPIPAISENQPEQLKAYINRIIDIVLQDNSKLPRQAIDLLLSSQSISLAVERLKKLGDRFYRGEFFSYCYFDLKQGFGKDDVVSVVAPIFELNRIRYSNIKSLQSEDQQTFKCDYQLMNSEMENIFSKLLSDVISCLNGFSQEGKYDNQLVTSLCASGVLDHVWMTNSRVQRNILDATQGGLHVGNL